MGLSIGNKNFTKWLGAKDGIAFTAFAAVIVLNVAVYFGVIIRLDTEVSLIKFRQSHLSGKMTAGSDPFLKVFRAREDIDVFKKTLPSEKDLTRVLSTVFNHAAKSGLKVVKGVYQPETVRSSGVSRYTINFPVEGGYAQVKKFLSLVEAMDTPVVVEDVAFSKGQGAAVAINIRLSAYYI